MTTTSIPYTSEVVQSVTTVISQAYNISSATLLCNHYVDESTYLDAGTIVEVSFGASGNLYLYFFNITQFYSFNSTGSIVPNVAEIDAQSNGMIGFSIPTSTVYYLVLMNRPGTSGCLAVGSVVLRGAYGTAGNLYPYTYTRTVTYYSNSSYPITLTTTITKSCRYGWLQAIFGCH